MTQRQGEVQKLAELNTLFMALDHKGRESALTILRSLSFAQSVTCPPTQVEQPTSLLDGVIA